MKNVIIIAVIFIIGIIGFVASGPLMNKNVAKSQTQVKNVLDVGVKNSAANPVKTFTIEDVASHNTKESCFLAKEGKVYDVSAFIALGMHKAGVDVIINNCGKDVTTSFAQAHDGKPKAEDMLAQYYIGVLK